LTLAIIDGRAPAEAILNLEKEVDAVFRFDSKGITADAISGHPDIFIYQDESNLIIAPNAPAALFEFLTDYKVSFLLGENNVGADFESSVGYNCLGTSRYFFHKKGLSCPSVFRLNMEKIIVSVPQAYTRCSLTHLGNERFITSDKGIEVKLKENNLDCFYFPPEEISIIGHAHGFLGGTNGLHEDQLFFVGNIDLHKNGKALRNYIENAGLEIVALCPDLLYDGGGIFFIEK
jgi:hypothetical protein